MMQPIFIIKRCDGKYFSEFCDDTGEALYVSNVDAATVFSSYSAACNQALYLELTYPEHEFYANQRN